MKKVTYLNGSLSTHKPVTLEKIVSLITAAQMPAAIRDLRDYIPLLSPGVKSADSMRVPAVIFSSVYKEDKWKGYTGLVLIEFNRLPGFQEACRLRNQIDLYKKPLLVFVGSSGRSVKVVVSYSLPDGSLPVSLEDAMKFHAHAYMRTALHYQEQFNLPVEIKEPAPDRICRISWDPDCCFHPDAQSLILEQPGELPTRKDIQVPKAAPYDPLAGILPGMQQYERISMLYELCLSRTLDEKGNTWQEDDPKTFLQVIGKYCYASAIPEENAVRWIFRSYYACDNIDLIRQTIRNIYRQEKKEPGYKPAIPKYMKLMMQIEEFMQRRYELRYNEITDEPEYREKNSFAFRFLPVTIEVMHDMCMNGQKEGIPMLDPDIKRYIISGKPKRYNPLQEFLLNLPPWDGTDRIRALADTVPVNEPFWRDHFYIWFLSMVAHWIKRDRVYGNSLVPVITGGQGLSKSVFFRMLLPPSLQDYYAENINPENKTESELRMSQNLLVNIDEFDRISKKHQAELKRLIQTPELKIRKPHQKSFRIVRRFCSFCATANPSELLTDPTGNRRYICVQLTGPIDITRPIEYEQLYSQAVEAVRRGEQYWLTPEQEIQLNLSNKTFLQVPLEIQYTLLYFRKPEEGETPSYYRAAHLLDMVSQKAKRNFSKTTERLYSEWLVAQGFQRIHRNTGNVFAVIEIK